LPARYRTFLLAIVDFAIDVRNKKSTVRKTVAKCPSSSLLMGCWNASQSRRERIAGSDKPRGDVLYQRSPLYVTIAMRNLRRIVTVSSVGLYSWWTRLIHAAAAVVSDLLLSPCSVRPTVYHHSSSQCTSDMLNCECDHLYQFVFKTCSWNVFVIDRIIDIFLCRTQSRCHTVQKSPKPEITQQTCACSQWDAFRGLRRSLLLSLPVPGACLE